MEKERLPLAAPSLQLGRLLAGELLGLPRDLTQQLQRGIEEVKPGDVAAAAGRLQVSRLI